MENVSLNNSTKSSPLLTHKLAAFFDAQNKTYYRGYNKAGEPQFGELPLLWPSEVLMGIVRRHRHLLDCEVHYFEITVQPVKRFSIALRTDEVKEGGDTNDRVSTPSNVRRPEQPDSA